MIRDLLRPICGWAALACLALALGCGGNKQPAKTAPALDPQLKARLEALNERADRLNRQIASLREETTQRISDMTSESQSLTLEANALVRQLGGKPIVPVNAKAAHPAAPGETAAKRKGPIGALARLMLIVIALLAIWIIARIFLGRMEEEEDEEDDPFAEGADEDAGTDEGAGYTTPESRPIVPPGASPGEAPKPAAEGAHDEGNGEPKP